MKRFQKYIVSILAVLFSISLFNTALFAEKKNIDQDETSISLGRQAIAKTHCVNGKAITLESMLWLFFENYDNAVPIGTGASPNREVYQIVASPKSGVWALLAITMTNAGLQSCVIFKGESWNATTSIGWSDRLSPEPIAGKFCRTPKKKRLDFVEKLKTEYNEEIVDTGFISKTEQLELLFSEQGSWTILASDLNKKNTCIIALGDRWRKIESKEKST